MLQDNLNTDPPVAADPACVVKVTAGESPGSLSIKFPTGRSLTLRHLDPVINFRGGFEMHDVEFLWASPSATLRRLSVKIYVDIELIDER
jgi:hypothetical protein